jgi:hypothetical protein
MTPMIGSRRKCERCREEKPLAALRVPTRIRLMRGPDGERLCRKHHQEAWEEHYGIEDLR